MLTSITKIGNSKGVIIPAHLLKQCGFENEISIEIKEESLIISKAKKPRDGWEQAFAKADSRTGEFIMDDIFNGFDRDEWTW